MARTPQFPRSAPHPEVAPRGQSDKTGVLTPVEALLRKKAWFVAPALWPWPQAGYLPPSEPLYFWAGRSDEHRSLESDRVRFKSQHGLFLIAAWCPHLRHTLLNQVLWARLGCMALGWRDPRNSMHPWKEEN